MESTQALHDLACACTPQARMQAPPPLARPTWRRTGPRREPIAILPFPRLRHYCRDRLGGARVSARPSHLGRRSVSHEQQHARGGLARLVLALNTQAHWTRQTQTTGTEKIAGDDRESTARTDRAGTDTESEAEAARARAGAPAGRGGCGTHCAQDLEMRLSVPFEAVALPVGED